MKKASTAVSFAVSLSLGLLLAISPVMAHAGATLLGAWQEGGSVEVEASAGQETGGGGAGWPIAPIWLIGGAVALLLVILMIAAMRRPHTTIVR